MSLQPPTASHTAEAGPARNGAVWLVLLSAVLFGTTGTSQTFVPAGASALSVGSARMVVGGALMALVGLLTWWRRRATERTMLAAERTAATGRTAVSGAGAPTGPVADTARVSAEQPATLLARRVRTPGLPTWLALAIAAAGMASYQFTFFAGTRANGVAIGTIVTLGSSPLMAGVFEWLIRGVRPGRPWLIATSCAIVGVGLLSGTAGTVDLFGLVCSITAGSAYALELVMLKIPLDRGWRSSDGVSWVMGLAALFSLPVLATTDLSWLATGRGTLVVAWLAVVTIVLAYQLLAIGLSQLPAATVTTLTLGEPATATLLGLIVLGEHLQFTGVLGIAAIAVGLVVLARASSSRR